MILGAAPAGFDYRTATEAEIMARARLMIGRPVGALSEEAAALFQGQVSGKRTKSAVGDLVESWFGKKPDNKPEPDFPAAGIELKSVPLELTPRGWQVKERTFITAIDYGRLIAEEWESASVRAKLSKILLVFYRWVPDTPIRDFEVVLLHLWQPDRRQLAFMGRDWTKVLAKVDRGEAHLLSESDCHILAPARKGAAGSTKRRQPRSDIKAKTRSWAFKHSFMKVVYRELTATGSLESLMDTLGLDEAETFEAAVLAHYDRFVGRRVGDIGGELGVGAAGKDYVARVARRALGQARENAWAREFAELGIQVKTVVAGADGLPYEDMSFPRFSYRELAEETWEDSTLRDTVSHFLFLPFEGKKGLANAPDLVARRAFFWSPSREQLDGIELEWTDYRDRIARGEAKALPGRKATKYIHVRPHARRGLDTDDAPVVGAVTKKSFWFNREFVRQLLIEHDGWSRHYRLTHPRLDFSVDVTLYEREGRYLATADLAEDSRDIGVGDTPRDAVRAALVALGEPYASEMADSVEPMTG